MATAFINNDNNIVVAGLVNSDSGVAITDAVLIASVCETTGTAITAISAAAPMVVTSTAHGRANGDIVVIAGVCGELAANRTYTVANQAANTFELSGSTNSGVYTDGGTVYAGVSGCTSISLSYNATTGNYVGVLPGASTPCIDDGTQHQVIIYATGAYQDKVHWEIPLGWRNRT